MVFLLWNSTVAERFEKWKIGWAKNEKEQTSDSCSVFFTCESWEYYIADVYCSKHSLFWTERLHRVLKYCQRRRIALSGHVNETHRNNRRISPLLKLTPSHATRMPVNCQIPGQDRPELGCPLNDEFQSNNGNSWVYLWTTRWFSILKEHPKLKDI